MIAPILLIKLFHSLLGLLEFLVPLWVWIIFTMLILKNGFTSCCCYAFIKVCKKITIDRLLAIRQAIPYLAGLVQIPPCSLDVPSSCRILISYFVISNYYEQWLLSPGELSTIQLISVSTIGEHIDRSKADSVLYSIRVGAPLFIMLSPCCVINASVSRPLASRCVDPYKWLYALKSPISKQGCGSLLN